MGRVRSPSLLFFGTTVVLLYAHVFVKCLSAGGTASGVSLATCSALLNIVVEAVVVIVPVVWGVPVHAASLIDMVSRKTIVVERNVERRMNNLRYIAHSSSGKAMLSIL